MSSCLYIRQGVVPLEVPFELPWHVGVLEDRYQHEAQGLVLLRAVPESIQFWGLWQVECCFY